MDCKTKYTEKYRPYINDNLFSKFSSSINNTVNYKNLNTKEIIGLTQLSGDNFRKEYEYFNEILRSKKNGKNKGKRHERRQNK